MDSLPPPAPDAEVIRRVNLEMRVRGGASWFFWIAGLSLVNSVVAHTGSTFGFIVGLGVTQIIDAFSLSFEGTAAHVIALSLNAVVAATFVGFGVFARRGMAWVYIFGMVLYALDGLVFAVLSLWLEFGFHVFALVMMWSGLSALLELKKLKVATAPSGPT